MTGAIDYLSDGERVIAVENGHPFLGQVTGVRYYPNKNIQYGVSRTDKNLTDWMCCWIYLGLFPHGSSF